MTGAHRRPGEVVTDPAVEVDRDVLDLEGRIRRLKRLLASDPGGVAPAERRLVGVPEPLVDADVSGLQSRRVPVCPPDVVREIRGPADARAGWLWKRDLPGRDQHPNPAGGRRRRPPGRGDGRDHPARTGSRPRRRRERRGVSRERRRPNTRGRARSRRRPRHPTRSDGVRWIPGRTPPTHQKQGVCVPKTGHASTVCPTETAISTQSRYG